MAQQMRLLGIDIANVVTAGPGMTTPANGVIGGLQGTMALSPGDARPRAPAAVTASRHLSNISVTVRPRGPSNRPLTTGLRPCMAACRARLGDGAGPGSEDGTGYARALTGRLRCPGTDTACSPVRSRHTHVGAQCPRPLLGSPSPRAPQKSGVTPDKSTDKPGEIQDRILTHSSLLTACERGHDRAEMDETGDPQSNSIIIQVASPPRRWKGLIRLTSVSSSAFRK
jgi:hypothetical protein